MGAESRVGCSGWSKALRDLLMEQASEMMENTAGVQGNQEIINYFCSLQDKGKSIRFYSLL